MSNEGALLRAIANNPDDDLTRLVYADWLDEHGEEEMAAGIRDMVAGRISARDFRRLLYAVSEREVNADLRPRQKYHVELVRRAARRGEYWIYYRIPGVVFVGQRGRQERPKMCTFLHLFYRAFYTRNPLTEIPGGSGP